MSGIPTSSGDPAPSEYPGPPQRDPPTPQPPAHDATPRRSQRKKSTVSAEALRTPTIVAAGSSAKHTPIPPPDNRSPSPPDDSPVYFFEQRAELPRPAAPQAIQYRELGDQSSPPMDPPATQSESTHLASPLISSFVSPPPASTASSSAILLPLSSTASSSVIVLDGPPASLPQAPALVADNVKVDKGKGKAKKQESLTSQVSHHSAELSAHTADMVAIRGEFKIFRNDVLRVQQGCQRSLLDKMAAVENRSQAVVAGLSALQESHLKLANVVARLSRLPPAPSSTISSATSDPAILPAPPAAPLVAPPPVQPRQEERHAESSDSSRSQSPSRSPPPQPAKGKRKAPDSDTPNQAGPSKRPATAGAVVDDGPSLSSVLGLNQPPQPKAPAAKEPANTAALLVSMDAIWDLEEPGKNFHRLGRLGDCLPPQLRFVPPVSNEPISVFQCVFHFGSPAQLEQILAAWSSDDCPDILKRIRVTVHHPPPPNLQSILGITHDPSGSRRGGRRGNGNGKAKAPHGGRS